MKGSPIKAKQNLSLELPHLHLFQKWFVIGLAGMLLAGVLTAGLYFVPETVVSSLIGIGIGLPLLLLVWSRPEFGLMALILLTSSFIPVDLIDIRLPIGGGLDLRDLVLLGLFSLLFVRELAQKTICIPWEPVGVPLVLFLIIAFVSTFYAIIFQKVEAHWALSDLRILSSYVVFFMVIWSVKRVNQLQILLIGLFIIADLTTTIVVIQQFFGANNPLLAAMMTTRDWRVYQVAGAVRVIPAGQVLMHFMWFIALAVPIFIRLGSRLKFFFTFQVLFIGVGHILTYMRAQWVAMFIGLSLIGLVILPKSWFSLSKYAILGLYILLIMALLWANVGLSNSYQIPFVNGIVDRFVSLLSPNDTLETDSLQWRVFENGKALDAILKQPLLGVGLGGRYRALTTFQGESLGLWTRGNQAPDQVTLFTRYVHNSYLSITVKMGIPALMILLWFCTALLVNGWKIYQDLFDTELKGIALGIIAGFVGLLVWSYFHAHFVKAESTPVIGLMAGLVGVIDYLRKRENHPTMSGVYVFSKAEKPNYNNRHQEG